MLTSANLTEVNKTLSLEKIKEICLKTELAMVGAYDGEGFVFWEKNLDEGKGFFTESVNEYQNIHEKKIVLNQLYS